MRNLKETHPRRLSISVSFHFSSNSLRILFSHHNVLLTQPHQTLQQPIPLARTHRHHSLLHPNLPLPRHQPHLHSLPAPLPLPNQPRRATIPRRPMHLLTLHAHGRLFRSPSRQRHRLDPWPGMAGRVPLRGEKEPALDLHEVRVFPRHGLGVVVWE